jgi:hypothetical protein
VDNNVYVKIENPEKKDSLSKLIDGNLINEGNSKIRSRSNSTENLKSIFNQNKFYYKGFSDPKENQSLEEIDNSNTCGYSNTSN